MVEAKKDEAALKAALLENEKEFELVKDPVKDRKLDDAACPRLIQKPLEDSKLWKEDGLPNWKLLKNFLAREGPITKE